MKFAAFIFLFVFFSTTGQALTIGDSSLTCQTQVFQGLDVEGDICKVSLVFGTMKTFTRAPVYNQLCVNDGSYQGSIVSYKDSDSAKETIFFSSKQQSATYELSQLRRFITKKTVIAEYEGESREFRVIEKSELYEVKEQRGEFSNSSVQLGARVETKKTTLSTCML